MKTYEVLGRLDYLLDYEVLTKYVRDEDRKPLTVKFTGPIPEEYEVIRREEKGEIFYFLVLSCGDRVKSRFSKHDNKKEAIVVELDQKDINLLEEKLEEKCLKKSNKD